MKNNDDQHHHHQQQQQQLMHTSTIYNHHQSNDFSSTFQPFDNNCLFFHLSSSFIHLSLFLVDFEQKNGFYLLFEQKKVIFYYQ
ncbi:hypothetical protein DERF_015841 [Dermatophagoides farinae]|uniref:Uncharacterized protein n=1 Tax=Dermatophagoides farinae TaxID=6954 RepID=A0A922HKI7_DERFA|nr:hypothetical protein DERF_015841 [Dermatophagoides farinae]